MAKKRKSTHRLDKDRQDNRDRMSRFAQKKSEEQAVKDSLARQQALERLEITQEFNYSDHAAIYNYADHAHVAPIETIDASITPPEITIEMLQASLPPKTIEPIKRYSTTMRAKQIMRAHCAWPI